MLKLRMKCKPKTIQVWYARKHVLQYLCNIMKIPLYLNNKICLKRKEFKYHVKQLDTEN